MKKVARRSWSQAGRRYNKEFYREILRDTNDIFLVDNDADALIFPALLLPFVTLPWIIRDKSRNPLWLQIVGPSGCGKTARAKLMLGHPKVISISTLTANSLMSGYRDKQTREDPSILKYADGKVLLVSDTAPIITLPREQRESIFGLLRSVYDGEASKATGMTGLVTYKCRMNCIMLATPIIDAYHSIGNLLGERFVTLRFMPANQEHAAIKAIENMVNPDNTRFETLKDKISKFISSMSMPMLSGLKFDRTTVKWLVDIATFCCLARHHVPRDASGRGIAGLSLPEVSTRLSTQLYLCLCGLCAINGWTSLTAEAKRQIMWIARCSMPGTRLFMLHWLLEMRLGSDAAMKTGFIPISRIRQDCPLAGSVVEQIVVDLHHADLLEAKYRGSGLRGTSYRLKRRFVDFLMAHEFFWNWNPDKFSPKFFSEKTMERKTIEHQFS